ncbi:unnamed protein product [Musa hybrid cultivar]
MFKHLKGMLTSSSSINACDSSIYLLGVVLLLFVCIFHVISTPHQRSSTVSRLMDFNGSPSLSRKPNMGKELVAPLELKFRVLLGGATSPVKRCNRLSSVFELWQRGATAPDRGGTAQRLSLRALPGDATAPKILYQFIVFHEQNFKLMMKDLKFGFVTQDDVLFTHLTVKRKH